MIHRGTPVPPYRQLAQILRQQIESGELPAESKLPSIIDLSAEYGVGAVTVRKAVALLKAEGLVVTVGGYGTFVVRESPGA